MILSLVFMQLTRDLFAIATFLFNLEMCKTFAWIKFVYSVALHANFLTEASCFNTCFQGICASIRNFNSRIMQLDQDSLKQMGIIYNQVSQIYTFLQLVLSVC